MNGHVDDRLSAYLDGELGAGERGAVESHLRECPACARHLEELAAVDAAARELPVAAPPGYFDAFPTRVRERLPVGRVRRPPAWLWAAAAALVLGLLAPLTLRRPSAPAPETIAPEEDARGARAAAAASAPPPAAAPVDTAARAKLATAPAAEDRARSLPRPTAERDAEPPSSARKKDRVAYAPLQAQKRSGPSVAEGQAQSNQAAAAPPPAEAVDARAARAEGELKQSPSMAKTKREEEGRGAFAGLARADSESGRYGELAARRPVSSEDARQLRDAWRAFADADPAGPRADEARVRAVEAGVLAFRLGGDPSDRARAREDARAYLARPDAAQGGRVRALLERLEP